MFGVQLNSPVCGLKVARGGKLVAPSVTTWPGHFAAPCTVKLRVRPSTAFCGPGTLRMGAQSPVTRMTTGLLTLRAGCPESVAVKVTVKLLNCAKFGVQMNWPVDGLPGVVLKIAPCGKFCAVSV